MVDLAELRCRACHPAPDEFEEHDWLRLVHFEEHRRVHVYTDEHHPRIVNGPMPRVVSLREPWDTPVATSQLDDAGEAPLCV